MNEERVYCDASFPRHVAQALCILIHNKWYHRIPWPRKSLLHNHVYVHQTYHTKDTGSSKPG